MSTDLLNDFRTIPVFADLADDDLRWLVDHSKEYILEPGDLVVREGDPADNMLIYLEGEAEARRESLGPDAPVFSFSAPGVGGMLPYSRMTHYTVTSRTITHSRIARLSKDYFPEMLNRIPALGARLVGLISDRVRESTKQDLAREKLASLGKLSAGLAHELNNPAAAASRAANLLRDVIKRRAQANAELDDGNITPEARALLRTIEAKALEMQSQAKPKNPLELSDRTQELQSWMEAHGVGDAWEVAPIFAEADAPIEKLERLSEKYSGPLMSPAMRRIATWLELSRLIADIEHSTCRISELVKAIKEYSFMDEAPRQEVDIAKGIESTDRKSVV